MFTKSGRYRIFSIADEPRFNPPTGMFHMEPEMMQGDWTFEETNRQPSIIERRKIEHGEPVIPCFYAPTYASADEALKHAEEWEAGESGRSAQMAAFLTFST